MKALMKPARVVRTLAMVGVALLLMNCPNPLLDQINARVAQANSSVSPFSSFSFTAALNSGSGVAMDVNAVISGSTITVTVPYGSSISALKATFQTAFSGVVSVNGITQTSGITIQDFRSPVIYTLTAADGTVYNGTVTVVIGPAGIVMASSTLTLAAGGNPAAMLYTISPPDASATFTWTTSNANVVKLTDAGLVTSLGGQAQRQGSNGPGLVWEELISPLAAGTATVTVKTADGTKSATCLVTVTPPVYVTGVSLNTTSTTMALGGTPVYLQATVAPSNATNQFVSWSSSTPGVASVDAGGTVTAVSLGPAVITATTLDGGKQSSCLVTVVAPTAVTGVSVPPTLSIASTQTYSSQIQATISPANATDQQITWSSDNTAVATVTNYGGNYAYVTPQAKTGLPATAHIKATTHDGSFQATTTVTVTAPVAVGGVSISQTTMSMAVGTNQYLDDYVAPSNATNQDVTWSTSDPSVVTFVYSYNGYAQIKALKAGSATITVTTVDGSLPATCAVTVTAAIPVYSISVPAITIARNSQYSVSPTLYPQNATNPVLAWSSNNTGIAVAAAQNTYNDYGTVTGTGLGSTTVTATATDGSAVSGSATVTVSAVTAVSIGATLSLSLSGTRDSYVTPTFTPAFTNANNIPVINLTTDNAAVATVSFAYSSGNTLYIFAKSAGVAHITVKAGDGSNVTSSSLAVTVGP